MRRRTLLGTALPLAKAAEVLERAAGAGRGRSGPMIKSDGRPR